jgi:hypothetical protein
MGRTCHPQGKADLVRINDLCAFGCVLRRGPATSRMTRARPGQAAGRLERGPFRRALMASGPQARADAERAAGARHCHAPPGWPGCHPALPLGKGWIGTAGWGRGRVERLSERANVTRCAFRADPVTFARPRRASVTRPERNRDRVTLTRAFRARGATRPTQSMPAVQKADLPPKQRLKPGQPGGGARQCATNAAPRGSAQTTPRPTPARPRCRASRAPRLGDARGRRRRGRGSCRR